MSRESRHHAEWLSLIEVSGPFLSVEVLAEKMPLGLEADDAAMRKRLRIAFDEWRDARYENDPDFDALHEAWVAMVFREALGYEEREYRPLEAEAWSHRPVGVDGEFHADRGIFRHGEEKPDFLVRLLPAGIDPFAVTGEDEWPVSAAERMAALCRAKGVRFGIVTNGESWVLVNAPEGSVSSTATWYAPFWFAEPVTLRAFVSLLGVRRLYGPDDERLDALLDESLEKHEEVTDTLGEQVRRAVELLVQSLDRADRDRDRELLKGVAPERLYEAGLTVMMRLVFLLSAEERGLLLLGDPLYDAHYAVSTLRAQLEEERARHGAEVLERRYDAWSRLLALFRAVHDGVAHESLRMPALGGSLFDPDRFPFLEGRAPGTSWRDESARPLPIDNRTVLLLLRSLQILERSGGALKLSYKGLDVEQIGHVYEGLLEYTVRRVEGPTLGLEGTKKAADPTVSLDELENWMARGVDETAKRLKDLTGRSLPALKKALKEEPDDELRAKLFAACAPDTALAERVVPFAKLLREDAWSELVVYPAGSFAVVPGSDRSATGAHYTPKSLTEAVVATTLEPILYDGPAEGRAREEWSLKSAAEILETKVCDPAMGSGAFLVQSCRYLAERLVEAWSEAERGGHVVTADGKVKETLSDEDPMPPALEERLVVARRLVAERCLYGVDLNPLAVELAKLSIWLVTLAKGRPFGFLDHNLRVGDSLLGVDELEKLTKFSMEPAAARPSLFAQDIEAKVCEVLGLRKALRETPIHDIEDVRAMAAIDSDAKGRLSVVEGVADAFVGEMLRTGGKKRELEAALERLKHDAAEALRGDGEALERVQAVARDALAVDLPEGAPPRRPFHWALEFPEVFVEGEGFDAIVGNPPFLGGQKITGFMGTVYRDYLVNVLAAGTKGSADLVAYFFLRAYDLLRKNGSFGLLATNTIAEGDTRQVGLKRLLDMEATVYAAYPNEPWPGNATVVTSRVHLAKTKEWRGSIRLNNEEVPHINSYLTAEDDRTPNKLKKNANKAFQGCITRGTGFFISETEAKSFIERNPSSSEVLLPYLNGKDVNSKCTQKTDRWAICFWDWSFEKSKELYPGLIAILEREVKPYRTQKKDNGKWAVGQESVRKHWWLYEAMRPNMYHALGYGRYFDKHPNGDWPKAPLKNTLVIPRVSKMLNVIKVDSRAIFADVLIVIPYEKFAYFTFLQSAFHEVWTWKNTSRPPSFYLRYTPSDCFETISFPEPLHPDWRKVDWNDPVVMRLESIGECYHETRRKIMLERQVGLTDLYNLFHDPAVRDHDIEELRRLHVEMDETVKEAYGWTHLDLGHDFHEVPYLPENDRVRFTVSEPARLEILKLLLDLNEERHEQEVEAGLWDKKSGKGKKSKKSERGLFNE
ncbi:Eco57I restriction-modification methylase domain-containing protein [Hydrogenimonas sp.]